MSCSSRDFLLGRIDVEPGVKRLRLLLDRGAVFRQVGLERVDSQAREGRRLGQGLDQLQTERFVGRLLEGGQEAVDFHRSGGPQRIGQADKLLKGELGPGQHIGRGRPRRHRLLAVEFVEQECEKY